MKYLALGRFALLWAGVAFAVVFVCFFNPIAGPALVCLALVLAYAFIRAMPSHSQLTPNSHPSGPATHQARQAAARGDLAALNKVFEAHGASVVRADDDPMELTTLHLVAAAGSQELVAYLLSDKICADPTAARINNFTPLHSAAMNGFAAICDHLIEAGADPNVQTDPQGYAPLHSAAWGGHVEAVRVLRRHGARDDLRNHRGEMPVETAERQDQEEVVAEFREIEPSR